MKVIMLLLVILMGICFWALLKMDNERHQSAESSTGGVIVHGCGGTGWVQNTNDFPVRIKEGFYEHRGCNSTKEETINWYETFSSGERRETYVRAKNYYHIYDVDDKLIGFIRPIPNGTVEGGSR